MGDRSVLEPESFATRLYEYLWNLVETNGGDKSGRWLSARSDRSKEYWRKIVTGAQAMNVNDIAIAADIFDMSPYDFVRNARGFEQSASQPVPDGDSGIPYIGKRITEEEAYELGAVANTGVIEVDDFEE